MQRQVTHIVGARPQFVKLAPVLAALNDDARVRSRVVHTGQHYDEALSESFFRELAIAAPDANLGIGSGSHAVQTGAMLVGIERDLLENRPDAVLVYGDTNSTLAGALAAAKLRVPIIHLEAGVRARDFTMPEEVNRVVTDRLADLLLAASSGSAANLRHEGVSEDRVVVVGDVMYDVALSCARRAERESTILERLALRPRGYLLATVHRAENTDAPDRLAAIVNGLIRVAQRLPVVLPVHPRTRKALSDLTLPGLASGALHLIDPVGYIDMARLVANSALVASDSGGVPKEAFFHRVRSAILREDALWPELVDLGWADIVPPVSAQDVAAGIERALAATPGKLAFPYGRGDAAQHVAAAMARFLLA